MEHDLDVERLAQLIFAEWMDSQSDSGAIWKKSHEALQLAKQDAGEEKIKQAYEIAYSRLDKLRRDYQATNAGS